MDENHELQKRTSRCFLNVNSLDDVFIELEKQYPDATSDELNKIYETEKIVLVMPNTKFLTSEKISNISDNVVFKIGGYKDEIIHYYNEKIAKDIFEEYRKENILFNKISYRNEVEKRRNKDNKWLYSDFIYTKQELNEILKEIEKIENEISDDWTVFEKAIFIYDKLKKDITYDSKFEKKRTKSTSTLRGLVNKKVVCAGYSWIYKELLNRQNIDCDYLTSDSHAWNVLNIEGKLYPVDLTFENSRYRLVNDTGMGFYWFANDIELFNKEHVSLPCYELHGKENEFVSFDREMITKISSKLGLNKGKHEDTQHIFKGERNDGSTFALAQIGTFPEYDYIHRYLYIDESYDIKILYSMENISDHVNNMRFKEKDSIYQRVLKKSDLTDIYSVLFSKENIHDSVEKNTQYLGYLKKNRNKEILGVIKTDEDQQEFSNQYKNFIRDDGAKIAVEKLNKKDININGVIVNKYNVYEFSFKDNRPCISETTVYTEENLFENDIDKTVNTLLCRENLDISSEYCRGYLGHLDSEGRVLANPKIFRAFNKDIKFLNDNKCWSSTEMKLLYEEYMKDGKLNFTNSGYIMNLKSNLVIHDPKKIMMAKLVEAWMNECALDELGRMVVTKDMEIFYNFFFSELIRQVNDKGNIMPIKLYEKARLKSSLYAELVYNMFVNQETVDFFNESIRTIFNVEKNNSNPKCIGEDGKKLSSKPKL